MARRMFRGEGHHKVDKKGRVSIPASYRRVLESSDPDWSEGKNPELVIVYGDHRRKYLECFTMEAVYEVDEKIAALPRASAERKALHKLFHAQSHPTNVDETGRIVLPAKLRDKIGLELESEAFFMSNGDTFQIWHPETYEAEEAERADDEEPDDFDAMEYLDSVRV